MKILIAVLFLLVCVIVMLLLVRKIRRGEEENRLTSTLAPYIDREYFQKLEELEAQQEAMGLQKEKEPTLLSKVGSILERVVLFEGYRQSLALRLAQAGMKWRASEYLTLMLGVAVFSFFFGFALGKILWDNPLLAAIPCGLLGFWIPSLVVSMKKKARQKAFQDQLVDTLGLISNSLKAGYSFLQAVEMVSREAPYPTNEEFQRLIKENQLGLPIDEAMEAMAQRLESEDFNLTVTVVLIQRQIGGNLAEILDNIAATIRERIKLIGTINALTAQGKMGGMVITGLPFGLFGIMYLLNPDVMGMLFKDKLGWVLIIIGLIMQSLGAFVIINMLKVEL
ncbi:MAG: secretion system protein [Candidatus Hydrogenedentota bacterium]|nr:MAG: secretion system protein [Candidatus Hydrogenedentota bacterium]